MLNLQYKLFSTTVQPSVRIKSSSVRRAKAIRSRKMVIHFLLSSVEVRLISITNLVSQVTHNRSTICMQISTFAKTGDSGPLCKTIIVCSILFKAFESRNEEVCNKNCSCRPTKGEQKHILYKNIKISRI